MPQARHFNTGLRARLRLRGRHAGAHRAPQLEHVNDESLEVCVPTLKHGSDTADLIEELGELLDSAADDTTPSLRQRP